VLALVAAFSVNQVFSLGARRAALQTDIDQAQRRTAERRQQASRIRAAVDPKRLEAVADAAREANTLIDRRTFSWTELFNHFEATLPPDVRITAVRPAIDQDGRFVVTMTVLGRSVEDISDFIEALEGTGAFTGMLSRDERTTEEGLIEATLQGTYRPSVARAPAEAR
jgi:Tfp pilus assembly protein PilN